MRAGMPHHRATPLRRVARRRAPSSPYRHHRQRLEPPLPILRPFELGRPPIIWRMSHRRAMPLRRVARRLAPPSPFRRLRQRLGRPPPMPRRFELACSPIIWRMTAAGYQLVLHASWCTSWARFPRTQTSRMTAHCLAFRRWRCCGGVPPRRQGWSLRARTVIGSSWRSGCHRSGYGHGRALHTTLCVV